MAEVIISPAARLDLISIDDYGIDRFGEVAADGLSDGFRRAFKQLGDYPRSAPERPDYGKDIRCLMYLGHRVLHLVEDDAVLIVRVLHHSRDVRSALEK